MSTIKEYHVEEYHIESDKGISAIVRAIGTEVQMRITGQKPRSVEFWGTNGLGLNTELYPQIDGTDIFVRGSEGIGDEDTVSEIQLNKIMAKKKAADIVDLIEEYNSAVNNTIRYNNYYHNNS